MQHLDLVIILLQRPGASRHASARAGSSASDLFWACGCFLRRTSPFPYKLKSNPPDFVVLVVSYYLRFSYGVLFTPVNSLVAVLVNVCMLPLRLTRACSTVTTVQPQSTDPCQRPPALPTRIILDRRREIPPPSQTNSQLNHRIQTVVMTSILSFG